MKLHGHPVRTGEGETIFDCNPSGLPEGTPSIPSRRDWTLAGEKLLSSFAVYECLDLFLEIRFESPCHPDIFVQVYADAPSIHGSITTMPGPAIFKETSESNNDEPSSSLRVLSDVTMMIARSRITNKKMIPSPRLQVLF
jgi:hypothetical protein